MLGASDDPSYIYFLSKEAPGSLAPQRAMPNLYLDHEGAKTLHRHAGRRGTEVGLGPTASNGSIEGTSA